MISLKIDAREFERALRKATTELPRQLRSTLNKASREARTAFLKSAATELNYTKRKFFLEEGGSKSDFTDARTDSLETKFRPSSKTENLGLTKGVRSRRKGGLTANIHLLSGGGSNPLAAPHGFLIKPGVAVNRTKFGKGTHRKGLRGMRGSSAAAVMAQMDNPVRRVWERTAIKSLEEKLPLAIEQAFEKSGL